jgi:ketosteroid isomerase-like protein
MSHDALRELHATNRIFEEEVVGKGDFAALDRVYTTTARILPPGSDVMAGIENIRSFWMKAAADLGVTAIQLRTAEVRFVDETAIEIGRATMATTTAGEMNVKYVVVWKFETGTWKWDIDIWNPVG